jgi:CRISPR type IV-associated protein Csf3
MRCCGLTLDTARFPTAQREVKFGDSKRCWRGAHKRWKELEAKPLRIAATLANGYIPSLDGALHLDGILAYACFQLWASEIEARDNLYIIPLPLGLAWVAPDGLPLWLATDMIPVGQAVSGAIYIHARYPDHRAELAVKQSVLTTAGRYKDSRVPLSVVAADKVEGFCFGDPEALKTLLDRVSHIGRKGAHGHGRVLRWSIEDAPDLTPESVLERRTVPVAYFGDAGVAGHRFAPRRGWSPPYWHTPSHAPVRLPQWTD